MGCKSGSEEKHDEPEFDKPVVRNFDKEVSDKFSNASLDMYQKGAIAESDNLHISKLFTKEWFRKSSENPDAMFQELATGECDAKHIDKATASRVANSLLMICLKMGIDHYAEDSRRTYDGKASLRGTRFKESRARAIDMVENKIRLRNTEACDAIFDAIDSDHSGKIENEVHTHA